MMYYPRVLVISNTSFSYTDSNGRTLGNLFIGWSKEKLAQFCISTDGPNFDLCNNYYCITDKEMLNAFLHFRKAKGKKLEPEQGNTIIGSRGGGKKTLFMMMVRNFIWGAKRWRSKAFMNWVTNFNPEIILLLFSDSSFILKIGTSLSNELNIPMVMFNTEGFYFFKSNYCRTKTKLDWLLFPIYQGLYRKQVQKTMKLVKYTIYLNQLLQADYDRVFGGPSEVLYTSSTLTPEEHVLKIENPIFSYIGNLTFDRPNALLEVADVLQSINPRYKLDIYGKTLDKAVENAFFHHPGISYKGFIHGYEKAQMVIRNSDILFHVETQNNEWEESLRYGFSTKIADSISSGTCFVLYSSPNIACAQYIISTGAGWFADNKVDLKKCIEEILNNIDKRLEILKNAQRVARENHSAEENCKRFKEIIYNCIKKV